MIQFSYRIDGSEWSPFTPESEVDLPEMKGGRHAIEVRSRDSDFNIDPTPLRAEFTVILPLWQQPWFIATLVAGGTMGKSPTGRPKGKLVLVVFCS